MPESANGRGLRLLLLVGSVFQGGLLGLMGAGVACSSWAVPHLMEEPDSLAPWLALFFGGIVLFLLGLASVAALWQSTQAGSLGLILSPVDSPALHRMLERLRRRLGSPRVDRVIVSSELNASVAILPRWGGVLGRRVVLVIGLPLLKATTPGQFAGIVAHELGHFSRRGSALQRRLYRVLVRWENLARPAPGLPDPGKWLVEAFAGWYAGVLRRSSRDWLRRWEFEADALAAMAVGPRDCAEALCVSAAWGEYQDRRFWPEVERALAATPSPAADFFSTRCARLSDPVHRNEAAGWLTWALAAEEEPDSTHPAVARRLAALGFDANDPGVREGFVQAVRMAGGASAADCFLPDEQERLTTLIDRLWCAQSEALWARAYAAAAERRRLWHHLKRDDSTRLEGETESAELMLLASLTEEFAGRRDAYPYLRRLLERDRNDAEAAFAFGRLLLEEDQEEGLPFLVFGMEGEPFNAEEGRAIAAAFYYRAGRYEEARDWEPGVRRHDSQTPVPVPEEESGRNLVVGSLVVSPEV